MQQFQNQNKTATMNTEYIKRETYSILYCYPLIVCRLYNFKRISI